MPSSQLSERLKERIKRHNRYKVEAAMLATKYLKSHDFAEAARWSDTARSHRFVVEVLTELVGVS